MQFYIALLCFICMYFVTIAVVWCYLQAKATSLIWERATQAARYDLDAAAQALKMQERIDGDVRKRVSIARLMVTRDGELIDTEGGTVTGRGVRFAQQPVDPNVKQTTTVDDVHELEREANRIINDDSFASRDTFVTNGASMASKQPPPPMEA